MPKVFKELYDRLFNSGESLSKIRDAALADRLFSYHEQSSIEVPGRSIAWKLFLLPDEPLKSTSLNVDPQSLISSLHISRQQYAESLTAKMRAPDGSFAEGFVPPGTLPLPRKDGERNTNLEKNNPLSLHTDNPWTEWFEALELRKTILQDVERTFPEIDFFRRSDVQEQLTNILFLYSATHPAIGYRQGMHELLAPVYFTVDFDSIASTSMDDSMAQEICQPQWVAADAWTLFEAMMRSVSVLYEWRESPREESEKLPSPFTRHVNLNVHQGPVEINPYIAPIVNACNRIQSTLLKSTDPLLWKHIQSAGIEPQIYAMRWLRLLFTREFTLPDAMKLWDGLFACDPTLELAPWICVAMLIRIRNQLIPADYTGQLTVLLRYPTPPSTGGPVHHAHILLRQALSLQMSPTAATGSTVVMENRNLLNIPIEIPEPTPPPRKRMTHSPQDLKTAPRPSSHTRQHSSSPTSPIGIPEMIARGLAERGESLGINKTLMNAVSELRRNIPELASSWVRTPSQTAFPLKDEILPEERPPWEPKSRVQMEREIKELRSNNRRLGESLNWVVDALLQDKGESSNPQLLERRRREALETLSYIRDVLDGNVEQLDDDRLFNEEEIAKKSKFKADTKLKADPVQGYFDGHISPRAPAAASVVDSGSKFATTPRNFAPPLPAQTPQYPDSPSPSLPSSPSSNSGMRLAPWNYTRSSFSNSSSTLPSTSLPRPPPRTSSNLRPNTVLLPASTPPPPAHSEPSDPLGVLS